jgi:hypothetical protein
MAPSKGKHRRLRRPTGAIGFIVVWTVVEAALHARCKLVSEGALHGASTKGARDAGTVFAVFRIGGADAQLVDIRPARFAPALLELPTVHHYLPLVVVCTYVRPPYKKSAKNAHSQKALIIKAFLP